MPGARLHDDRDDDRPADPAAGEGEVPVPGAEVPGTPVTSGVEPPVEEAPGEQEDA